MTIASPRKLLILEPFRGGHFDNYLHVLARSLSGMQETHPLPEIVLAVAESRAAYWRSQFPASVAVDGCFPLLTLALSERLAVWRATTAAVRRIAPDVVLCMSADAEFPYMNFLRPHWPRQAIGVFHSGHPPVRGRNTRRAVLQALIYDPNWRSRAWTTELFVNPVLYQHVKGLRLARGRDIRLLPDPVERPPAISRKDARQRLGLPPQATILGMLGTVDRRKAVHQLIEGFRAANLDRNCILAIAGAIGDHPEQEILEASRDLVESGRMILCTRYLSQEELDLWYAAVDATAPLYFDTPSLSSNLLRSLAFRKPVLVNSFGYSGMVVDRFAVGLGCRLDDPASVSDAVQGVMSFASPRFEADVTRLLAFHAPENFSRIIWEAAGLLKSGPAIPNVYDFPAV
jgi:glycosyltransferase involved in cell wall biosynthesis